MKKLIPAFALATVFLLGLTASAGNTTSWTGEVLDLKCYQDNDAHGPDHAQCAKRCVKSGQPMGLLAKDGSVVRLEAHPEHEAAYEALKELAGEHATVAGILAEKDGMKVVTVIRSKAAD